MSSVWVQLYYEYKERVEIQENRVDIEIAEIPNGNISGLARRLKENDMKNDLSHCDRGRIRVYPPGTKPPFSQANSTGKSKPLKDVIYELKTTTPPTSHDHPLIVVAPAPEADDVHSGLLGKLPARVEIDLGMNSFSQITSYFRKGHDTELPTQFNIGATHEFSDPFLDLGLFSVFEKYVATGPADGNRLAFVSAVAMPGWGKTYTMNLLAKSANVCRGGVAPEGDGDSKALAQTLSKYESLGCCVPLAITLNSDMELNIPKEGTKHQDELEAWYSSEIAQRLVYAYFADLQGITFSEWKNTIQKKQAVPWECAKVLRGLVGHTRRSLRRCTGYQQKNPILLLLIDEPNKGERADQVLHALKDNALSTSFAKTTEAQYRVVMSALEQHWLFQECTASNRQILPLVIEPPVDHTLQCMLTQGLMESLGSMVNVDDVAEVAQYVVALARGHWRTISSVLKKLKASTQRGVGELKEDVGDAPAYVSTPWRGQEHHAMKLLEEALAHAIIGSKLEWMEPIHNGTAWQAVARGVILQFLGLKTEGTINPVVSLLLVLRLAEEHRDLGVYGIVGPWRSQTRSISRDKLLVQVLGHSRFFPTANVSSNTKAHKRYESMAARFMLLRWDAYERIDAAVRSRWSREDLMLPLIKEDSQKKERKGDSNEDSEEDPKEATYGVRQRAGDLSEDSKNPSENGKEALKAVYNISRVKELRDKTNAEWVKSHVEHPTAAVAATAVPTAVPATAAAVPTAAPRDRPRLWLVPPSRDLEEQELRLCIFRGASNSTGPKEGIRVLPPDFSKAEHFHCRNKLMTSTAAIKCEGELPAGSVVEPAEGNEGFDSLVVLKKPCGTSAFALIENKFENKPVNQKKVEEKLSTLMKHYRMKLWRGPTCDCNSVPTKVESLSLPCVNESDVVWVLLADTGVTNGLDRELRGSEIAGQFQGSILLMESDAFFGCCFGKVGILDQNRRKKSQEVVATGKRNNLGNSGKKIKSPRTIL